MTAYHAIETARGWSIRKSGSARASQAGLTEFQAWKAAKLLAKRDRVTAYKHDKTGRIVERAKP